MAKVWKVWHVYQFLLGEPLSWWDGTKAGHVFDVTDKQKPQSAKVEGEGWRLVFESDNLVVKAHDPSGITQIWVPEEKGAQ